MKQDVINSLGVIYGLPNKSIDILHEIIKLLDSDNCLQLDNLTRINIYKITGKSVETINKYIGLLVTHKILLRKGRGLYQASNKLFTDNWNSLTDDSIFKIIITFKDNKQMVRVKAITT